MRLFRLALSSKGKKLNWKLYARAIYKIALGFVAYDMGHEAALHSKYQPARDFILNGNAFSNNMLVSTKSKPHYEVSTHCDLQFGGTPFFINIFGMVFMINLEENPVLQINQEFLEGEEMKAFNEIYQFELVSLS